MQRFLVFSASLLLCCFQTLHAQPFIQAWATLADDADPRGIAIDASGNVYTSNGDNNTVSKITADGTVTQAWVTLADGADPIGIAIDGSGNVYIANYSNSTVSKITSSGKVTQAWATLASDAYPTGIAIDGSGNVYTANSYDNTVSKIIDVLVTPVTLVSFTAVASNSGVQLNWQTGVETNSKGFKVQSSINAKDFNNIAFITSKGSNSIYQYTDNTAYAASTLYYRLNKLDIDGGSTYSNVIAITKNNSNSLALYPNPANSYINISISNAESIRIYNASGVLVKTAQAAIGISTIDIHQLSAGTYYLVVGSQKLKFVKM